MRIWSFLLLLVVFDNVTEAGDVAEFSQLLTISLNAKHYDERASVATKRHRTNFLAALVYTAVLKKREVQVIELMGEFGISDLDLPPLAHSSEDRRTREVLRLRQWVFAKELQELLGNKIGEFGDRLLSIVELSPVKFSIVDLTLDEERKTAKCKLVANNLRYTVGFKRLNGVWYYDGVNNSDYFVLIEE